jgi:hypothetical protein
VSGVLSGIAFEVTDAGNVPVEGVEVYCDACGPLGHTFSITDGAGVYTFDGVAGGTTVLLVYKSGYNLAKPDRPGFGGWTGQMDARVNGDTRFDIELVRQ